MEPAALLSLIGRRRAFLGRLSHDPMHKRDLVEAVDRSRSTIDRGLAELEEAGLVVSDSERRFSLTPTGEVGLETYRDAIDTLDSVSDAEPMLAHLPDSVEVPAALFRSATVTIPEGPDPLDDAAPLLERLRSATSVRLFGRADHAPDVVPLLYRRSVVDEALDVQAVVNPPMETRLETEYGPLLEEALGAPMLSLRVSESLPFGMYLLEDGDERSVFVATHDETLLLRGYVLSEDAVAVEWAADVFEEWWADAEPMR